MLRLGSRAYFSSPSSLWVMLNYRKEVDERMQYSSTLLPSLGMEVRLKASWMWKSKCEVCMSLLQKYNGRSHDHISEYQVLNVQAGFRKGRGTRDQIADICWIIQKGREFQKNIYFCFIDYAKAFDWVDHNKLKNSSRDGNIRPPDLPLEKSLCRSGSSS